MDKDAEIKRLNEKIEFLERNNMLFSDWEHKVCIFMQRWVGLTDEEKSDLWCKSTGRNCVNEDTHVFADAIEAKLKERNGG